MSIVTSIITALTSWVSGFVTLITESLSSVVAIFYDSTTGLTVIGSLALLGLAIGLVGFVIAFVRGLINK